MLARVLSAHPMAWGSTLKFTIFVDESLVRLPYSRHHLFIHVTFDVVRESPGVNQQRSGRSTFDSETDYSFDKASGHGGSAQPIFFPWHNSNSARPSFGLRTGM